MAEARKSSLTSSSVSSSSSSSDVKAKTLSRGWTPNAAQMQQQQQHPLPQQNERRIRKPKLSFKLSLPISSSSSSSSSSSAKASLPSEIESLEPIVTTKDGRTFPLQKQDLVVLSELGRGAYGVVERCRHGASGLEMAVKRVALSMDDATERRRLLMDLEINGKVRRCQEAVFFYGAAFQEGNVFICMEIMDSSMDKFYRKAFEIGLGVPEDYLVHVAFSVIMGLLYLYANLKVMHRDVKPSNILIDKTAAVKVCDFGVSAVMINSLAPTNIGCKPYMAPERLDMDVTKGFTAKSDVWSLGVTLVEIGDGQFPYESKKWKTPFDQMKAVFESPPPTFSNSTYSAEARRWVARMLTKRPEDRADYATLVKDEYVEGKRRESGRAEAKEGLVGWATKIIREL